MRNQRRKRLPWLILGLILLVIAVLAWITNIQAGIVIAFIGLVAALGQWLLPIKEDDNLTSGSSQNKQPTKSPFLVNEPLDDPDEFFGRDSARTTLIERTRHRASTSIVGPRRTGKTWLISYLKLVVVKEFNQVVRISYIDPRLPRCATIALSVAETLTSFGEPPHGNETMSEMLIKLEDVIKDLKSRDQIPILCIEKFERLCQAPDFNLEDLETLRAITSQGLVLIISSREPLSHILMKVAGKRAETSPFYIGFIQLTLEPFNSKEAEIFVHNKSIQTQFTKREQELLLKYGQRGDQQWPPLLLQLAGKMLLEEKRRPDYQPDEPKYLLDFLGRLEKIYENAGG